MLFASWDDQVPPREYVLSSSVIVLGSFKIPLKQNIVSRRLVLSCLFRRGSHMYGFTEECERASWSVSSRI